MKISSTVIFYNNFLSKINLIKNNQLTMHVTKYINLPFIHNMIQSNFFFKQLQYIFIFFPKQEIVVIENKFLKNKKYLYFELNDFAKLNNIKYTNLLYL